MHDVTYSLGEYILKSFYSLNFNQLTSILCDNDLNVSASSILFNHYYKKKMKTFDFEDVSKRTKQFLIDNYEFSMSHISKVSQASDKTVKFLIELRDGSTVETVLIPFHGKYSICVSSQVGCAMKCSFCYTGTQGLKRNLNTNEIIEQFLLAWNWLVENRGSSELIQNIVFMGQGEPLHNFDAVRNACDIFLSQYGFSIGAQKITISTSGFLPGLKRWAKEIPGVNLALSLHSPFSDKRNELIPINRKYPLEEVLNEIDSIPLSKKQFITYEYLLIDSFNDSEKDAHETGRLLVGKEAYINLIPFNPFPGSEYNRPSIDSVLKFKAVLDTYNIPTLVRTTKGDDVLAACGQLNSRD